MWTPKRGVDELVAHVGHDSAFLLLTRLLSGEPRPEELSASPYREAILHLGKADAASFLQARRQYWLRVWAARALAYLGDDGAADALAAALRDPHWRVRMTAVQSLGRLGVDGSEEVFSLLEDPHERVRAAAATALGRTGDEFALPPLQRACDDGVEAVRRSADRALARLERRVREQER